jgi:AraC-like DNA-binding protein
VPVPAALWLLFRVPAFGRSILTPAIPPLDALNRSLPITRTTDAAVARRCLGRVFAHHRLEATGGAIDFAHQQVSLGETSASLVRYGAEVAIVAPPLDFYLLQVTLAGRIRLQGPGFDVALEADSVFVMNPGVGYRKCWDRDAQQLMLKIPRRRLEWLAPDLLAPDLASADGAQAITFAPTVLPAGPLTEPLRQLLDQLAGHAPSSSLQYRQSSAVRASENHIVRTLLADIPYRIGAYRDAAGHCAVPHHVWRAERYMRANPHSAVTMSALAAVAGVSKRTLQDGFQRFRGKAPSQVARDLRLDLAREALVRDGFEKVTDVALEYGFTHLGRFAQAYAARFGESPSDTLRRSRSPRAASCRSTTVVGSR